MDLGEQLARDGMEVPKIVEKCAEAIEAYGLFPHLFGLEKRILLIHGQAWN